MLGKEIELFFTSDFTLRWNDKGSGATMDGAFWQPVAPGEFRPLGSLAVKGYDDADGRFSAICLRKALPESTLLTPPRSFELVWADHGSGADKDGSCWRAVPISSDYVALGDLFMSGYGAPTTDQIWCVHKSLLTAATIGELIWNDAKSGADRDFSAWAINWGASMDGPQGSYPFLGVASHQKPAMQVFGLKM
jgi:hypothetical protein